MVAGQELIYSYIFVLEAGKLLLSLLNTLFTITERSLRFLLCILTHFRRRNELRLAAMKVRARAICWILGFLISGK